MKNILNAMKFGTQSRSSSLIINMIFEIADLDPKLKTWADLVSKLQCAYFFFFFNFDTKNKFNMLIMNILIPIHDLEPKLEICEIWSQN